MDDTILRVDDIQKFYGNKGNLTKAIDHISFSVRITTPPSQRPLPNP